MWKLDHKEGWALENRCLWIVVLEKTLESPSRRSNQSILNDINPRRTDAEAPILWPTDMKSRLTGKDPDAGKDWRQEKGMTEDEMVGWHHWFNGHEFEQVPGVGERQGNLACCRPWFQKESIWFSQLNDNSKYLEWDQISIILGRVEKSHQNNCLCSLWLTGRTQFGFQQLLIKGGAARKHLRQNLSNQRSSSGLGDWIKKTNEQTRRPTTWD